MSINYFSRDIPATKDGKALDVTFAYSRHDPWAVKMTVATVPWVFARDLIRDALAEDDQMPLGDGDVTVTQRGRFTVLALHVEEKSALIELNTEALKDALIFSSSIVDFGEERIPESEWSAILPEVQP